MQSRSIYQVSGDRLGEAAARLLQTLAQLDYITCYRLSVNPIGATFAAAGLSLLENAEEQCRQVLISCHDSLKEESTTPYDATTYEALARLLQIFIQRAIIARLRGQDSNALRERIHAAFLCQKVLDTLTQPVFPWKQMQEILFPVTESPMPDSPFLPRLPELRLEPATLRPGITGLTEIYCAAALVVEELGRTGATPNFRYDCYRQADHCFHTALALAHTVVSARERDPGYLVRCHQRYAHLLEERLAASPEDREETISIMLALLKDGLSQFQNAVIPG